jgi:prepilin-type N-terminal cleavage/methylation domain-containing protein
MALRHHFRTGNDKGFTLVEIIAVLVILMLVLPAIYTSYTTAARTSELALLRLRCLGIARQELEYRKSLGYDKLNTGLDDEQPKVESFTTPDGIKVVTTLESTTVDTDTEKDSNAVRVTVEAGTRSMNVEIVALVVEGGF